MSKQFMFEPGVSDPRGAGRSLTRWTALAVAGFMGAGCFSYTPTDLSMVPPGEDVELMVTRDGSEAIARVTESNELRPTVRGQLMGLEEGSVMLRVPVETNSTSNGSSTRRVELGRMVPIPEISVLAVGRREFNAGKTALLMGGVAAVSTLLLTEIFDAFRSSSGRDRDPGTQLSVGVFRFAVP